MSVKINGFHVLSKTKEGGVQGSPFDKENFSTMPKYCRSLMDEYRTSDNGAMEKMHPL